MTHATATAPASYNRHVSVPDLRMAPSAVTMRLGILALTVSHTPQEAPRPQTPVASASSKAELPWSCAESRSPSATVSLIAPTGVRSASVRIASSAARVLPTPECGPPTMTVSTFLDFAGVAPLARKDQVGNQNAVGRTAKVQRGRARAVASGSPKNTVGTHRLVTGLT